MGTLLLRGLFIADEPIEKEKSNEDLNKLAKRLSNEILSDVFHLKSISEQNTYASDLKSTIKKNAISKASSLNLDNNNKLHGQLKVYIGEIVRNAVDKAFSTIQNTPTTSVHIDGTYLGKRQLNDVEIHSSDSSFLASQQQSDRPQSKRSSVEVGHDDSSDEEDDSNFLSPQKVCNEKEFWRKSLIDDLEDDLNFDETETTHSSAPSSPGASQNLESGMFDDNPESEEEALGTLPNVKVQTSTNKNTDHRRSRLRSVDSTPVLVLDNGSGFLKAGYSNEAVPSQIVSSVVGTPLRYSQDISGIEYSAKPGSVFGDQATGKAGVLRIDYPLKCDLVEKWSDVEGLWDHVFNGLMVIPEHPDFSVLVSQSALSPKKNTEKIAEIMFEHFHMPSLLIVDQLTLSLFSTGYTSGLSFNSGFKSTQAGVVYEGHVLPHTVKQLDIAGYQLTENLKKLLMSLQGFGFRSSSQWQIVDNIKKTMGYFSLDFEGDSKRFKSQAELQKPYELPDGQVIEVGLERFGCAESLFRPMEIGLTQSPAHKLIIDSINSCESELQEQCYKTMSVSGGTTLMKGFTDRLEQELRADDRRFKNFVAPENRHISTWLGGSVMASLPTFQEMVVTVDEYAEAGARVVHSKCF
ncbi:actin-3-like [Xenia sp. Carnegie-2017]|uniref:actin-3-like n=1 Tax=Xenia sp. Carnegie-2017 TaxID=2897299 RepID=UPI001F044060|nr:actin-3-like [Xenia sp. Carnegie-2017]